MELHLLPYWLPLSFTFGVSIVALKETTSAVPSPNYVLYELGLSEIILIGVFTEILAKGFTREDIFLHHKSIGCVRQRDGT
jgi:hypothetical protein